MYLVLDQGGQSSRAAVFAENGELLQLHQQPVATQTPKNGWVEQNPQEIIQSLRHCLAQIQNPSSIKSAALVTQRSSFVCWRRDSGEALSPVISWQDTRGSAILSAMNLCPQQVRQRTGLFPNSHFGASKMAWCLREMPAVVRAQAEGQLCVGPLSSYILYQLAEENPFVADACNAQRTLLYNIGKHAWDDFLLRSFCVPEEALPKVGCGDNFWGHLLLNGQRVPIKQVCGDQNAAFVALGQGCPETAVINAGSGAFIGMPIANPVSIPERLLQTVLPGDSFIAEGTVNGAARALVSISDQLGCDHKNTLLPGEGDPIFLNGEGGLAAPYWQADFTSRFIGQGTAPQQLAAVQESIVFLLYRCFLEIGSAGESIQQIKVAGGLSQSDVFCQTIADVFQKPVIRPDVIEASAAGAALLLGAGYQGPATEKHFTAKSIERQKLRFSRWRQAMETALDQHS